MELSKKYPEKVVCVSLSLDYPDAKEQVEKFLKEQKATFTNVITADPDAAYDRLEFGVIPAIFIFDAEGNRKHLLQGAEAKYEQAGKLVAEMIAG